MTFKPLGMKAVMLESPCSQEWSTDHRNPMRVPPHLLLPAGSLPSCS